MSRDDNRPEQGLRPSRTGPLPDPSRAGCGRGQVVRRLYPGLGRKIGKPHLPCCAGKVSTSRLCLGVSTPHRPSPGGPGLERDPLRPRSRPDSSRPRDWSIPGVRRSHRLRHHPVGAVSLVPSVLPSHPGVPSCLLPDRVGPFSPVQRVSFPVLSTPNLLFSFGYPFVPLRFTRSLFLVPKVFGSLTHLNSVSTPSDLSLYQDPTQTPRNLPSVLHS